MIMPPRDKLDLMVYPQIIQGGMGVSVSSWRLANAVGSLGQMGVVSGTALDTVLARRLQCGDEGGLLRQALDHFPIREMAERIWQRYYIPGGKAPDAPFKSKPVPNMNPGRALVELTVVANFVEVWLAKRGHIGPIGLNLLEKIQIPTLPSLYGAMLAKVDTILMGAGIPRAIPGVLEKLARGERAELPIACTGNDQATVSFDPADFGSASLPRPKFYAIVSSNSLATMLAKKCQPPVDGFIIEASTAGGHNAPPRGTMMLSDGGEPIYGDRDIPDLAKIAELGLPFWLAGTFGTNEKFKEALASGAQGVQIGTGFAFCEESGLREDLKRRVIDLVLEGKTSVFTDPLASPTGFPFKVVQVPETISAASVVGRRTRICDLGYLREPFTKDDGTIAYRCAAEPIEDYVAKGGTVDDTDGRKCICNGLMATAGLAQTRKDGYEEPPIITAGDDVVNIGRYMRNGARSYTAQDVIDVILGNR